MIRLATPTQAFFALGDVLARFDRVDRDPGVSWPERRALLETARWLTARRAGAAGLGRHGSAPAPVTPFRIQADSSWSPAGEVTLAPLPAASSAANDLERAVLSAFGSWCRRLVRGEASGVLLMIPVGPAGSSRRPVRALPRRTTTRILTEGHFIGSTDSDAMRFAVPCSELGLDGPHPVLLVRALGAPDLIHIAGVGPWVAAYQDRFGSEVSEAVLERIARSGAGVPEGTALAVLDHLRRWRRVCQPDLDPLTGLPGSPGCVADLRDLHAGDPDAFARVVVITIRVANADERVRGAGHRIFELALFRLAHALTREMAPQGWRGARTGYGELTWWRPATQRPEASQALSRLEARLGELGSALGDPDGWAPRFGIGMRRAGRGRAGARTGHDAAAADRAHELFARASQPARKARPASP